MRPTRPGHRSQGSLSSTVLHSLKNPNGALYKVSSRRSLPLLLFPISHCRHSLPPCSRSSFHAAGATIAAEHRCAMVTWLPFTPLRPPYLPPSSSGPSHRRASVSSSPCEHTESYAHDATSFAIAPLLHLTDVPTILGQPRPCYASSFSLHRVMTRAAA